MADKQLNEQQLQALLRLKRFEQPPPGYFDNLLVSVQLRQRQEMLRRPFWRLGLDRIAALWNSSRVDWTYGGAMAGIFLLGILGIQLALPQPGEPRQEIAEVDTTPSFHEKFVPANTRMVSLQPAAQPIFSTQFQILPAQPVQVKRSGPGPVRYDSGSRPAAIASLRF